MISGICIWTSVLTSIQLRGGHWSSSTVQISINLKLSLFQGMGRPANDGEVAGPQIAEHPLPPGWHKEGGRATTYFEYVIILKKEQFLSGPTRVGKTRPAWEIPWRQAKGKIVHKTEYHLWFSSLVDRIGERCVHRTLQPGQVIKFWCSALFTLLWVAVFCSQSNTSLELKIIQGPKWRQELSARNGESQQVRDVCRKKVLFTQIIILGTS